MKLATVALLFAASAVALAEDPWMPVQEGAKWTYVVKKKVAVAGFNVVKEGTATLTVTGKEKVLGVDCWVFAWSEATGNDSDQAKIWMSAEGQKILVLQTTGDFSPIVPVDFDKKEYNATITTDGAVMKAKTTVVAEEEVEVPAGKYKTEKVETSAEAAAAKATTTVWYARGVGPVRVVRLAEAAGAAAEKEFLLKSFEKGGK